MCNAVGMPQISEPPRHLSTKFNCPRCGAFAGQSWSDLHVPGGWEYNQQNYVPVHDNDNGEVADDPFDQSKGPLWEVSYCAACEDHSLWIGGSLAYPYDRRGLEVPEPVAGMPDDVRELYVEAAAVMPYSRRAAAALCRASLERLAKRLTAADLGPKKSLDERLIALSHRTTASLARAVQIIRHAGNTALHGARDDDESVVIYMEGEEGDLIDLFFVTINELVDELITRPLRIDAAYQLLPEEKREAIRKKLEATP